MLEWSDQTLAEAQAAYDSIMNFIEHDAEAIGEQPSREEITGVSADDLPVDFVAAAQAAYDRIMNFIEHAAEALGEQPSREEITGVSADDLPVDVVAAMNDDVNVSRATSAIFTQVRAGNTQLTEIVDDTDSD